MSKQSIELETCLTVYKIDNGHLVNLFCLGDESCTGLYSFDECEEIELLKIISENLFGYGSKHDEKRIYVCELPGRDHPDYEEKVKEHFGIE